MPNLEQTGLLHVDYVDLAELCRGRRVVGEHPSGVRDAEPASFVESWPAILLDELRRVLAIDVDCLTQAGFDQLARRVPAAPHRSRGPSVTANASTQVGTAFARSGPGRWASAATSTSPADRPSGATCAAQTLASAAT